MDKWLHPTFRGPVNFPHKWPVTRENVSIWWRHHVHYLQVLLSTWLWIVKPGKAVMGAGMHLPAWRLMAIPMQITTLEPRRTQIGMIIHTSLSIWNVATKWPTCLLPTHMHNVSTVIWWRHQMETFSTLLALCAGNSPVTLIFLVTQAFFCTKKWKVKV